MYIYKITNNINGKEYIGYKTKTVNESKNYYGSGIIIKHAIKKYGKDNFSKNILYRGITSFYKLKHIEKECIRLFDTFRNGYNLTLGGDGILGLKQSEKSNKLRSISMTGKKHTEETKNLLSKLKIGNTNASGKRSEEFCKNISEKIKGHIPWNKGKTECLSYSGEKHGKSKISDNIAKEIKIATQKNNERICDLVKKYNLLY